MDLDFVYYDKEDDVGNKTDIPFAESLTLVEKDAAHRIGKADSTP